MNTQVSVSIDVENLEQAVVFYTNALGCKHKVKYTKQWEVITLGELDIHIQEKKVGTTAAGTEVRHYDRHWTPVHLDFGVTDVRQACDIVEKYGGRIESQSFSDGADIAVCADPFGNGFCLIRE
ncbi:MAG: lactoylglutathione lyase [Leptolyngbya sp. SIO1D8]|nr:lactoylglutathione lyase [Leptolyngbya sp. SIO1D8]